MFQEVLFLHLHWVVVGLVAVNQKEYNISEGCSEKPLLEGRISVYPA